jgi:hypothetical protein
LSFVVTAGQCSDAANIGSVLDAISVPRSGRGRPRKRPTCLRVDRAYGARHYRREIQQRGIRCVCPERLDAQKNRLRKGRQEDRHRALTLKRTKDVTSSSAPSTD